MQRYNHGNLAVREHHEPHEHKQVAFRETKQVVRKQIMISGKEKFMYLMVIMMCVVIAGSVIWKHAEIYDVNTKMQQLEKEVTRIDKENQELKLEVSKLDHPERLSEMGKQLGFKPIEDEHVNQISSADKQPSDEGKDAQEVAWR